MRLRCLAESDPALEAVTSHRLRKRAVGLSPSAFDPPGRSPTLVFEQALQHQNSDHSVPIHLKIDGEFFDGLTVVCKEIAERHQLLSIG